jgi:hypothetical protein
MLKIADLEKRKSPLNLAAHTGWNSWRTPDQVIPCNPALSIPPVNQAQICVWLRKADRHSKSRVTVSGQKSS